VVVWLNEFRPDVFAPAAHAFGMGLGVLLAARGAREAPVDLLGAGLTATAAGLVFMLEPEVDSFGDPTTFAVVLAGGRGVQPGAGREGSGRRGRRFSSSSPARDPRSKI